MEKQNREKVTATHLREILCYKPKTGVFIRIKKTNRSTIVGSVAGSIFKERMRIGIDGETYLAHRLAWLWVHGVWPTYVIDHKDGNSLNNRIDNLRDVPQQVNMQNRRRPTVKNKSGYLGVHLSKQSNLWCAMIFANDKVINLGRFKTPLEAHQKYLSAKRSLHIGNTL